MASTFFALLDDITLLARNTAVTTKVAAMKAAGVTTDDLAVNAVLVNGVKPERELPMIWDITKGSFKNKLIIVPVALGVNVVAPAVIPFALIGGGLFLCFEGIEKIKEMIEEKKSKKEHIIIPLKDGHQQIEVDIEVNPKTGKPLSSSEVEREKVSDAIKTDFVLSTEIIVIALGTMAAAPFLTQVISLSTVAVVVTGGVYGLVAGIVKADDIGLHLMQKKESPLLNKFGEGLVNAMPGVLKGISYVGTAAMLAVGGEILVHNISPLNHALEAVLPQGGLVGMLSGYASAIAIGIGAGIATVKVEHMIPESAKEKIANTFSIISNSISKIKSVITGKRKEKEITHGVIQKAEIEVDIKTVKENDIPHKEINITSVKIENKTNVNIHNGHGAKTKRDIEHRMESAFDLEEAIKQAKIKYAERTNRFMENDVAAKEYNESTQSLVNSIVEKQEKRKHGKH